MTDRADNNKKPARISHDARTVMKKKILNHFFITNGKGRVYFLVFWWKNITKGGNQEAKSIVVMKIKRSKTLSPFSPKSTVQK